MVHCGYEPTAANDAFRNALKMLMLNIKGIRTEGPMAKDIDLSEATPGRLCFQ